MLACAWDRRSSVQLAHTHTRTDDWTHMWFQWSECFVRLEVEAPRYRSKVVQRGGGARQEVRGGLL